MKKLILLLIVITTVSSCTKDLPQNIRIHIDIMDADVYRDGSLTYDPSLKWKYYDEAVSRAKNKNAIIVENPNNADYIIRLTSINASSDIQYEYKNGRGYYLRSFQVSTQAKLYDYGGTYLTSTSRTCSASDQLKYDNEYNQYYVEETYKDYFDLTTTAAYHNTNNFVDKINDYEGF